MANPNFTLKLTLAEANVIRKRLGEGKAELERALLDKELSAYDREDFQQEYAIIEKLLRVDL